MVLVSRSGDGLQLRISKLTAHCRQHFVFLRYSKHMPNPSTEQAGCLLGWQRSLERTSRRSVETPNSLET
jgi:hypothetical protein